MSDLLPKLVAFLFCLAVCVVGLYFQRKEQVQERKQREQRQQKIDYTFTGFADLSSMTIRSSIRVRPPWTQEEAQEKTQGKTQELGSLEEQQQGRPN